MEHVIGCWTLPTCSRERLGRCIAKTFIDVDSHSGTACFVKSKEKKKKRGIGEEGSGGNRCHENL